MSESSVPRTDYSKIARHYDKLRSKPIGIWVSKIILYGEINPNSVVLDVGCGTGRYPLRIQKAKNCLICAFDPSIDMLKQAVVKDESRDILWVRGEGQKLPFKDDSFDCIYMTLVLHHIENKKMALLEIYRVLKKGGKCVIMTNSHTRMRKSVLRYFPGITAVDIKRFLSVPSLKESLTKIGFKDVHYHIVKQDEEYIPTAEYLERVKNKYISTLTLLSEERFQKGFNIFQEKLRRKYGTQIRQVIGFDFVIGEK